jgi:EAL domain-containing protein (putative c-di-GMP-specific phosphodiesterase class I)
MQERATKRLQVECELRHAISADELTLHYQPKVSIAAGGVNSVEALVRWHHPERGLLMPNSFIPIAERSALIEDLTAWTLRRACRDGVDWMSRARRLRVAVNIAGRLVRPNLLDAQVEIAIDESGFDRSQLEIEITETCMFDNRKEAMSCLLGLRERGHTLTLDDFGTGYSSLSHLRNLPVDWVKLDRSFTVRLDEVAGIVSAVVEMAHSSGLRVVAEGVEYRDQAEVLLALGCDALQGFYFSHPVPLEELDDAIARAESLLAELSETRGRRSSIRAVSRRSNTGDGEAPRRSELRPSD